MGSYHDDVFQNRINKNKVKTIFELGSRDLIDSQKLFHTYQCPVYAFECNPDCIEICKRNHSTFSPEEKENIHFIDKAICEKNEIISFYPFDLSKYDNMGSSSMFKIDFSNRHTNDPDYNRENPQKEVQVQGIRLDTFLQEQNIEKVDLLCMDLQGYELQAVKSLGDKLKNVKYIITECSTKSTYIGGTCFDVLYEYLQNFGFVYGSSTLSGDSFPNFDRNKWTEFDSLFINNSI